MRSGYVDDYESEYPNAIYLYRGAVDRAVEGKRGQAFLRELLAALDAMPVKELTAEELIRADGQVCALGALAQRRGIDVTNVDPENARAVGKLFNIAQSLAREVVFENDDDFGYHRDETPAARWTRMRKWVADQIRDEKPAT